MKKKRWRLIIDQAHPAARNMAVDEALFRLYTAKNDVIPTLRFYRWQNPTLSFGSSQKIAKAADIDYCCRNGIDLIRRPTGGRAVLHDDEVTYSVIARTGDPFGSSIQDTYRMISTGILKGLNLLGLDAQTHGKGADSVSGVGYLPCFASSTKFEIAYDGKKIVGSAQRRNNSAFLQHGSILLRFDSMKLVNAISAPVDSTSPNGYMISISQILGRDIDYNFAVAHLVKGFEKAFDIELIETSLSKEESAIAGFFEEVKYRSKSWNHCK